MYDIENYFNAETIKEADNSSEGASGCKGDFRGK